MDEAAREVIRKYQSENGRKGGNKIKATKPKEYFSMIRKGKTKKKAHEKAIVGGREASDRDIERESVQENRQ